jgi:hypothetical protein
MHFILVFLKQVQISAYNLQSIIGILLKMQHNVHDQEFPKRLTCLDATNLPCVPSSSVAFMLQKGLILQME